MADVFAIVTHLNNPIQAAEEWKKNGLCSMGGPRLAIRARVHPNNFDKETQLFLGLEKGDLILAYVKNNTIAYVGDIIDDKLIPRKKMSRLLYNLNKSVKWWDEPYYFKRFNLPKFFSDQLGKPHRTISPIDLGKYSFNQFKNIIITNAISGSGLDELSEDMIKFGFRKYLRKNFDELEKGLRIENYEYPINGGFCDFIGTDKNGRKVIVECKGIARPDAVRQLNKYGKNSGFKDPRLILIAYNITNECIAAARKYPSIELFECKLSINKI